MRTLESDLARVGLADSTATFENTPIPRYMDRWAMNFVWVSQLFDVMRVQVPVRVEEEGPLPGGAFGACRVQVRSKPVALPVRRQKTTVTTPTRLPGDETPEAAVQVARVDQVVRNIVVEI